MKSIQYSGFIIFCSNVYEVCIYLLGRQYLRSFRDTAFVVKVREINKVYSKRVGYLLAQLRAESSGLKIFTFIDLKLSL